MTNTTLREFAVDNASILFLSLIRPYHTNNFRFSAKLKKPVSPEVLQEAVNRIHRRFPSVVAGLRQDFFHYRQVASDAPPVVQPDPGLLKPMSRDELHKCAFRVYYQDSTVSIEAFHALTDGFGAIACLTALVSEYIKLLPQEEIPCECKDLIPLGEAQAWEVEDSYLGMADVQPKRSPSRFSYLPPRPASADWQVRTSSLTLDTKPLLDAAHRHGVTLNTLLTTVLASTVMQMQIKERGEKSLRPVRIMVPVNLRKMAGSRTLRNCSLYTLPTMEGHHRGLSIRQLCKVIHDQLQEQLTKENLFANVSSNVRMQNAWYFRMLPWKLKSVILRLGYRFFGESNSSLTLTNLGVVKLPEALQPHVEDFQCMMTPRVTSPYGCTIMSFGNKLTLNMSRFCLEDELGQQFFHNLMGVIEN